MVSLNFSLSESLRTWIRRRIKGGGYETVSEFAGP